MYKFFFLIIILTTTSCQLFAQNDDSVIYLYYNDKNIKVEETTVADKIEINLHYNIFSKSDSKATTYIFKVDNISSNFKFLKFEEIKDTIKYNDIKELSVLSLKDLEELDHCDLHMRFSDINNIYIIKKIGDLYFKFKLKYWSTRRGWEISDN